MSIDKLLLEIYELTESEDYEKSLELCNQILKLDESNEDALNNKALSLFKLGKCDEALEIYKKMLTENPVDVTAIDGIKRMSKSYDIDTSKYYDDSLYVSWISLIKSRNDAICPDCGSHLMPLTLCPSEEMMELDEMGFDVENNNYYCRNCDFELYIDVLNIDCGNHPIECAYLYYKLDEITVHIRYNKYSENFSLDELKSKMDYFDDEEFNAFLNKLKEVDYICEDEEGHVRLVEDMENHWFKHYIKYERLCREL
ncbi:tetratricopeptide repeat protein [Methanobrevibacter sp.]|uniref:tetratricopeptide repeat protein n=1 Tax=Methanobrevibacter sp. TaxID=66852 RepID=UPI003890B50D